MSSYCVNCRVRGLAQPQPEDIISWDWIKFYIILPTTAAFRSLRTLQFIQYERIRKENKRYYKKIIKNFTRNYSFIDPKLNFYFTYCVYSSASFPFFALVWDRAKVTLQRSLPEASFVYKDHEKPLSSDLEVARLIQPLILRWRYNILSPSSEPPLNLTYLPSLHH